MPESPRLSSSEIGVLWMTYQQKTMILTMLEYFIEQADDPEAKQIMTNLRSTMQPYVGKIESMYRAEDLPVPIGFTKEDVNKGVPKLFDNGFDIMFLRLVEEITMGMHTLNLSMSYRPDVTLLYQELTQITQKCYDDCTQFLLTKGYLPKSPYVAVQKQVEHAKGTNYISMFNPIKGKRALNTVEIAHIHHSIESNVTGMQMIFGFAQSATHQEISNYFHKGGELAKGVVKEMSEVFLQNDLPVPSTAGGNFTTSKIPPFSDKLMMYCVSLFCSFSLGGNSLGTAFSLRNDLPVKLTVFMKDVFEYAHEGAKIMIKHGWMEEPPQTIKH
ncbi:DUF3231 family protein [Halobacillus trueperi]|uniref:DUF3231 family protein n=1 Tax=Halobacillus trueperi TaxID=156205 RepID=A0A3D8VTS0_9BACI|nr:DUF3231 family protein [Halobacillus trueperi]RDY72710.1 DUF3231 family protein [Halobacillus trueperi]